MGGFAVKVAGKHVNLPLHARRVLAYLSLDKMAAPDCDRGVLADRLGPMSAMTARAPVFVPPCGGYAVPQPIW
jgi:hypothetical protein